MSTFDERRRARASWPVRAFRLGEEPLLDERDTSTVDERIALVWRLTCEQWALGGQQWPDYQRSTMPGRLVRRRDG